MVCLNKELKEYIDLNILPQYDLLDKAHNMNHINDVINNIFELGKNYDVDMDMLYICACYHDLGNATNRELHHLISADILRNDEYLNSIYDKANIELMAQAIEDHRASNKNAPRSLYGEILSSADRVIDVDTIIIRTYHYGVNKYPEITYDEQLERIYTHILEKYGEGGYLKVPIMTSKNQNNLNKLQALVKNKDEFMMHTVNILKKLKS